LEVAAGERGLALASTEVLRVSEISSSWVEGRTSCPGSTEKESTTSNEQAAPETKGVTAELLATVDLGPEIEGMAGRQLRMRTVTIEPGGVFGPIHDHKDRPGIFYILQGTITDHRHGVATDYGPGVGWPEDTNTTHWLENRGTIPAVEISVDIVRQD
jgi:quercetin dioxygenase-like cupin family protein